MTKAEHAAMEARATDPNNMVGSFRFDLPKSLDMLRRAMDLLFEVDDCNDGQLVGRGRVMDMLREWEGRETTGE